MPWLRVRQSAPSMPYHAAICVTPSASSRFPLLLRQGKLMLVRELVRALERLGLGLGANGRPGLISLLLKR